MTTSAVRAPAPDSPVLHQVIDEIAADARRRRESGGGRPERAIELVREHRIGAIRVPEADGGAGYTKRDFYRFLIRLGRVDPDVPHILRLHYGFTEAYTGGRVGTADGRWLEQILAGKLFGGAGSELAGRPGVYSFHTRLVPDGEDHRLSGEKFYSTGSMYADYLRVSANDEDDKAVNVVIPATREGIVHVDDWDGIGQRETGSGTTLFENVLVKSDELAEFPAPGQVGRAGGGAFAQLYLHAIAAGILQSVVDEATDLLRARGRSYSWGNTDESRNDPQLLEIVGRLSSIAFVVETAVLAAAEAQDRAAEAVRSTGAADEALELEASLAASKVKVAVEELALRAAGDIFNVGGASWTRSSLHLDRHWRNLRTLFSHNPTVFKARAIGDHVVNNAPLPAVGFF